MGEFTENIVIVKVTKREDSLDYHLEFTAELPLFKHYERYNTCYVEKTEKSARPKRFKRVIKRTLLKAQKRYNKILDLREYHCGYRTRVNLTHKL